MRQLLMLAALAIATDGRVARMTMTGVPLGVAPRATTISSIHYLEDYSAGDKVRIWRGQIAAIKVSGKLLDLATGVEATTTSGAKVTGLLPLISSRTGGDNTSITIDLSASETVPLGTYQILIHYLVETNGPDRFLVQVFDRGVVNTLRFAEPPDPGPTFVAGRTYTLVATGQRLENAALFVAKTGITGLTVSPAGTPSSTEKRFSLVFRSAGTFRIDPTDFIDQNLTTLPPTSCPVQCYSGSATTLTIPIILPPAVASVSSRTPNAGTDVTISGTGLVIPGYSVRLIGRRRYAAPGTVFTGFPTASGSNLVLTADANMRQDSLRLEYRPTSSSSTNPPAFVVDLPTIAVQGGAPEVLRLDIDSMPVFGSTGKRGIMLAGTHTLRGKFLSPYILESFTLATSPTKLNPGTFTTPVSLPSPTVPTQPALRYVTSLDLSVSRYEQNSPQPTGAAIGVDVVTFSTPNFTDTITADLKITTPFGTASVARILHVPPPAVTVVRRLFPNGQTADVTDGKLVKGATYGILGKALIIAGNGPPAHFGTVRLNGATIPVQTPQITPGSLLVFTLPSIATSGPLTVQTVAGTTAAINFTVVEAPPPIAIAGFQVSPSTVVGGQPVTGTVAFNAAISAGTNAGTVVVSQTTPTPGFLTVPLPRTITSNPIAFTMPTKVARVPVSTTVSVAIGEQTASTTQPSAVVNIVPPSPTSVTLANASVVGGAPATATIQMNGSATLADSILITLTNTDPTTATVPSRVFLNGNTATVQIPTQVVPNVRTVTITATSGGQSRSATLTVNPPTVAAVTPASASVVGPATVPIALSLTAPLPVAQTATIACSGEGLTCPTTATVSGTTGSFSATVGDVPSARTGTVTVTLNGVSKTGTVDMQPLAIASMTASPATVAAGVSSSITLQLNHIASIGFRLASSDSTVIVPPNAVPFAANQLTQLVTIATRAPQTQPKTVTITATGNHVTPFGTFTIMKSVTVTVTP